jgi:hypothetical protein
MHAAPSPSTVSMADHERGGAAPSVLAALGRFVPPFEIDRFGAAPEGTPPVRPSGVLDFRFCFAEVPFHARAERRQGRPMLTLSGDLGTLPFTIENARRRHRLRLVLAAAQRRSGLTWEVTAHHAIRLRGEIELELPLTPVAVLAGAVALLMKIRPYLDLVVAVAGEA